MLNVNALRFSVSTIETFVPFNLPSHRFSAAEKKRRMSDGLRSKSNILSHVRPAEWEMGHCLLVGSGSDVVFRFLPAAKHPSPIPSVGSSKTEVHPKS